MALGVEVRNAHDGHMEGDAVDYEYYFAGDIYKLDGRGLINQPANLTAATTTRV